MIKIAFVTNSKAPYRKLQFEEFAKNNNFKFSIYYTNKNYLGRKWNVEDIRNVNEYYLGGIKISKKYGYLNTGLINIVTSNDLIIIGGYEQPTYIILSILCRILNKPYIILFDGISTNKLENKENSVKLMIKKNVVKHSRAVFANGQVSKLYFTNILNYPEDKIYNQVLTVDVEKIFNISKEYNDIRTNLSQKYGFPKDKKIILYSGRLVEEKNVENLIVSISKLKNKEEYILLIVGGGQEEQKLIELSQKLGVNIYITGFLSKQEELFRHYLAGDVLVLPSIYEPWGLVVNEALAAGLPVLVSEICGCRLDLVKEGYNGFTINAFDIDDISNKIEKIFQLKNKIDFKENSYQIIREWTFKRSRENFEKMIKDIIR